MANGTYGDGDTALVDDLRIYEVPYDKYTVTSFEKDDTAATATGAATVKSNRFDNGEVMLVIATYDASGNLKTADIEKVSLEFLESKDLDVEVSKDNSVRLFIWEADTLYPLGDDI